MTQTTPLGLPEELVPALRPDLTASAGSGWFLEHESVAFAADGSMYTLSRVPWASVLRRHPADGTAPPEATAVFRADRDERRKPGGWRSTQLTALPDGQLAASGQPDCTMLLSSDLGTMHGAYQRSADWDTWSREDSRPFASHIGVTPSGRLLCLLTESGVTNNGGSARPNLLALGEGSLTRAERPVLDVLAALDTKPHSGPELRQRNARPYVRAAGRTLGLEEGPAGPGLAESVPSRWPDGLWGDPWLGAPAPLADDLFVVPVFGRLFRSGNRGNPFVFVLLDDEGRIQGRLEGLRRSHDSPFTGNNFTVVSDPPRRRAWHLNRYGLYVWSGGGDLLMKLSTESKPFTALKQFRLLGCSPAGELVLAHVKQHLLLRIPLPDTKEELADGLGAAVEAALRAFGSERTALKRSWGQTNWLWSHPTRPDALHYL